MSKKPNHIVVKTTYLSDTITELPYGIINKTETGIGATTLELNCKRNSIIVEPLRVTASAKAHKHNALYVGSPTKLFSDKIKREDIQNYLNDKKIEHKKIVVVADSLYRVIELIPKEELENYFLMIDECDSFQLDSKFRNVMENCYEIYKNHPLKQRCMITATPLLFSDPDIANEEETIIQYEKPITKEINLFHTDNNIGLAHDKIAEILKNFPDDKIVVAFNNVTKLLSLANTLVKNLGINENKISILCGMNSKNKAGKFYKELDSSSLPTKIVLKTSAYFTGFDIDDPYHLLILVNNADGLNCLSELRIKQIAGRCRAKKGLLSNNILQEYVPQKIVEVTKDDLIEAAQYEIDALNCINKTYEKSSVLHDQIIQIRELIMTKTHYNGFSLVKLGFNSRNPKISYLNIDAALELTRVRKEVYKRKDTLSKKLKSIGNIVTVSELYSKTEIEKTDLTYLIEKRIKNIESNISFKDVQHLETILMEGNPDYFERYAYETYITLQQYVKSDYLIENIIKYSKSGNISKLKNFLKSAEISILEENSSYKQALSSQFIIGETYNHEEIHNGIKRFLMKMGMNDSNVDEKKAVKIFRLMVSHTRNSRISKTAKTVKGFNPLNIPIVKYKSEFPDVNETLANIVGF
jgi:hypothetical protein